MESLLCVLVEVVFPLAIGLSTSEHNILENEVNLSNGSLGVILSGAISISTS